MLKRILLMPLTKRSMIPLIVVVLFAGGTWIGIQLQKSGNFQRTAVLVTESKVDRPAKQAAKPPRSTSTVRSAFSTGKPPAASKRNANRLRVAPTQSKNQSQFGNVQSASFKPLPSPPRQNFSEGRFNVNSQVKNSSHVSSQPRQTRIASLPPSTSTFSRPQPDNSLFAKSPLIQTPTQQSFAGPQRPKNASLRPSQNANNRLPQPQAFAPRTRSVISIPKAFGSSKNDFGSMTNVPPAIPAHGKQITAKPFADGHWAFSLKNSHVVTADLTNPIEFEIETKYGIVNVNSEELVAFHVVPKKKKSQQSDLGGQTNSVAGFATQQPPPHPPHQATAFVPHKASPAPTPDTEVTTISDEGSQTTEKTTEKTTDSVLDELLDIVNEADPAETLDEIKNILSADSENQDAPKLLKDVQSLIKQAKDTRSQSLKSEETDDSEETDTSEANDAEPKSDVARSKQADAPTPATEPDYRPDVMVATKTGEIFTGKCTIKPIEVKFAWGSGTVNPESINFFANRENGIFGIQKDPSTKSMFLRRIVIAQAVKHLQNGDRVR